MPAGDRLLAGIDSLLKSDYADYVRGTVQEAPVEGLSRLTVSLHPAAPAVAFTASDAGRLTFSAETAAGGPGYHRFVGRTLGRMADEVGIEWSKDELDQFAFAERSVAQRAYLGWLGDTRRRATPSDGERAVQLALPEGTRFTFDGAIATPLGPRSDEWLAAAVAEPNVAVVPMATTTHPAPTAAPASPMASDVQPVANETRDRIITGIVTVVPFLALGVAGWQVWAERSALARPGDLRGHVRVDRLGVTVGFHRHLTHRSFATSALGARRRSRRSGRRRSRAR